MRRLLFLCIAAKNKCVLSVFILTALVSAIPVFSYAADSWVAIYNGPTDSGDYVSDIAVDSSGNVYVTGRNSNYDPVTGYDSDYATIKYDPNGTEQWVVRYDWKDNDSAEAIAVDASGNVYVTGNNFIDNDSAYDTATIKSDPLFYLPSLFNSLQHTI